MFSGSLLPAAFARLLRAAQRVRRLLNACVGIVQIGAAGIRAIGIMGYTQFLQQQFVMLELRIGPELIAGLHIAGGGQFRADEKEAILCLRPHIEAEGSLYWVLCL